MGAMEGLINPNFWRGKSVFLSGHTGFKGGWLAAWLIKLGCRVHGYSLPPDTEPSFFALTGLESRLHSRFGDILDAASLKKALADAKPDLVFHLAAQALVRRSYREPAETFAANLMGTVNLLDAARAVDSVRGVVVVTSDKCYEGSESPRGEDDLLGGSDPYSASKACAELACAAYRRSFFSAAGAPGLATARAGNVFGGGDFSEDRIIPDALRAFEAGRHLEVRNPASIRPWQHVLDPLSGYLLLAEKLATEPSSWSEPWNFGPPPSRVPVSQLVARLGDLWGGGTWMPANGPAGPPEAHILLLDSAKASRRLNWRSRMKLDEGLRSTVEWHRAARTSPGAAFAKSVEQIDAFDATVMDPA